MISKDSGKWSLTKSTITSSTLSCLVLYLHSSSATSQWFRACLSPQSLHWLDRPSFLLQTERLALGGRVSWVTFKANLRQSGGSCCTVSDHKAALHPLPQGGGVHPGLFSLFSSLFCVCRGFKVTQCMPSVRQSAIKIHFSTILLLLLLLRSTHQQEVYRTQR